MADQNKQIPLPHRWRKGHPKYNPEVMDRHGPEAYQIRESRRLAKETMLRAAAAAAKALPFGGFAAAPLNLFAQNYQGMRGPTGEKGAAMADANKTGSLKDIFDFPSESNATERPPPEDEGSVEDFFNSWESEQERKRKAAERKKLLEELRLQRQAMNFPENVRKGSMKPSLPPSVYNDATFK